MSIRPMPDDYKNIFFFYKNASENRNKPHCNSTVKLE